MNAESEPSGTGIGTAGFRSGVSGIGEGSLGGVSTINGSGKIVAKN